MNIYEGKENIGFFNILIILLSVYVLITLFIDTIFTLPTEVSNLLESLDNVICIVFLIDFFVRFFNSPNKFRFMIWGWVDLVSSIPFIGILRVGRVFRLIRLFRVLRAFRSMNILVKHIFKSKIKGTMTAVGLLTILVIIFSSILILLVETAPESNIKTGEDAIWWTIETITTVGYGDRFPVTSFGRLVGVMVMAVGVGLFGVLSGYIASLFVGNKNED